MTNYRRGAHLRSVMVALITPVILALASGTALANGTTEAISISGPSTVPAGGGIVFVLTTNNSGSGIEVNDINAATGPATTLNFQLIESDGTVSVSSGTSFKLPKNSTQPKSSTSFLIVSSNLATSTTITFTATLNSIGGGPGFGVTWTPGPLDHFAVSVTGTTSPAVLTSTNVQVTAQDAFNNTITGFTGAVTQSFTTNGAGGPAALGAFNSVPASPYTFLVGDNGVRMFAITDDLAEPNVTVNVSSGGKAGSADKDISWTQAPVQTFAFTPASLLTTATNQTFGITSFKTSSRLPSGEVVTFTFPDDTDLSGAATTLGRRELVLKLVMPKV